MRRKHLPGGGRTRISRLGNFARGARPRFRDRFRVAQALKCSYVGEFEYYPASNIYSVDGRGLSGQFLIGGWTASGNLKLVNVDGSVEWTVDNTTIDPAFTHRTYSVRSTASAAYWTADGDASGRGYTQKVSLVDGSAVWTTSEAGATTPLGKGRSVDIDTANGDLYALHNDSADEIIRYDESTGSHDADTTDSVVGAAYGLCVTGDGNYLAVLGQNEEVEFWTTPMADGAAPDGALTIDFAGGVDTTLTWSSFTTTDATPMQYEDRLGDGFWIIQGWGSSVVNEPYLMHVTWTGSAWEVDVEINLQTIVDAMGLITSQTYNHTRDIAVAPDGSIYALYTTGGTSSTDAEVLVFPANVGDGATEADRSFVEEGCTVLNSAANCIAVNEDYEVLIGRDDGYAWIFTQAA